MNKIIYAEVYPVTDFKYVLNMNGCHAVGQKISWLMVFVRWLLLLYFAKFKQLFSGFLKFTWFRWDNFRCKYADLVDQF